MKTSSFREKLLDIVVGLVGAVERLLILWIGWHPRHSHEDEDEEDGAPEGRLTLRGPRLYFIVPGETESLYPAGGSQSGS